MGMKLGYKHHGIPIMLLANGGLIIRPSRAEVALLHTYLPQNPSAHRMRGYVQALMKWITFKGLRDYHPFWKSVAAQVHRLDYEQLSHPLLIKYFFPQGCGDVPATKKELQNLLDIALAKHNFSSRTYPTIQVEVLNIEFPCLPSTEVKRTLFQLSDMLRSPFGANDDLHPNPPALFRRALFKKNPQQHAHSPEENAESDQPPRREHVRSPTSPKSWARSSGHLHLDFLATRKDKTPLESLDESDLIFCEATCGLQDIQGADEVDSEREQVTCKVKIGRSRTVDGLDSMVFGGPGQMLRPDVDRLVVKVMKKPTYCTCLNEDGLFVRLLAGDDGVVKDDSVQHECEVCSRPVQLAGFNIGVQQLFVEQEQNRCQVLTFNDLNGVVLKIKIANVTEYPEPHATLDSQDESKLEELRLRTHGDLPLYDDQSLLARDAQQLFQEEQPNKLLKIQVIQANGLAWRFMKSPAYEIWSMGRGIYCKVGMAQQEKMRSQTKKGKRVPRGDSGDASGILQSIAFSSQLQVDFQESFTFASYINGLEEIVLKVCTARRRTRFHCFGGDHTKGYCVIEVQKLLKLFLRRDFKSFSMWFPLRGPKGAGKVLVGFDLVDENGQVSCTEPSAESFHILDEDASFSPAQDGSSSLSRLSSHPIVTNTCYQIQFTIEGLRFIPSEFIRVHCVIKVRDRYNPRHALVGKTKPLPTGVMAHLASFPEVQFTFGDQADHTIEDSQEIVISLVTGNNDTSSFARMYLQIRDLLADFAAEEVNDGNLVDLHAWVVVPCKSIKLKALRSPEVKIRLKIKETQIGAMGELVCV